MSKKHILLFSLISILLTSCAVQYQPPKSGPTATVNFDTYKEIGKYQIYAFEKSDDDRKGECFNQHEIANIFKLNYEEHLQFKIPADKKLIVRVVGEQVTHNEIARCDMTFSLTPKAKTVYTAKLIMDSDNPNCGMLISEHTSEGLKPLVLQKENLNQSFKRRLFGDNTFCRSDN